MIPHDLLPLANHLWQSTVFAGAVALLAWAFRRNSAALRFRLWLTASMKFVVPFSLLVSAGRMMPLPPHADVAPIAVSRPLAQVGAVLSFDMARETSAVPPAPFFPGTEVLACLWACGFLLVLSRWTREWARVRRAAKRAVPVPGAGPLSIRTSAEWMEPGVFGIFRPVLLLPAGMLERLDARQLAAIVAHERCHVKRHDNLTAALHMLMEAVFWFHPLVWWIGARMVEERENACDEAVVRAGNKPETYAEAILTVCRFCLESPLPCVAGATGASLKKRVEAIMKQTISTRLTAARKLLLTCAGLAAVAGPILLGVLHAPGMRAQNPGIPAKPLEFDVATIKPSAPGGGRRSIYVQPGGGISAKNFTLNMLIALSYSLRESQISGAPAWAGTEHFDIEAKASAQTGDLTSLTAEQLNQVREQMSERVRQLLAERFQLAAHTETKEMPIYALMQAKGGSKEQAVTNNAIVLKTIRRGRGTVTGESATIAEFTMLLGELVERPVIDQTGLSGKFDWKMEWTPEAAPLEPGAASANPVAPAEISGPSLFTALQQQLGLKLESRKGPAPILVIDKVEKPSVN